MRLTSRSTCLFSLLSIVLIAPTAQAVNTDQLKDFLKTNQCQNCDLSGANLERLNLSGANLQGANLSGATLTKANLSNANLSGANLQGAALSESYLYRSNLTGTNFSNAGLSGANLRETTLTGTNFSRADLRSANLQGNNLGQATFAGANLSQANLSQTIGYAFVSDAVSNRSPNFSDFAPHLICGVVAQGLSENQTAANLDDLTKMAETAGFKLQTTDWTGVNLAGATLQNSVVLKANLSQLDLTGVNLQSACLFSVKLTGAKLDRTNWQNARLVDTDLPPGDIPGAIALKPQRSQALRVKESAGRITTGSMMRAQQAYYLENSKFTNSLEDLSLGIPASQKSDYLYRVFVAPDRYPAALNVALSQSSELKTFISLVVVTKLEDGESTTVATLCSSENPAMSMPLWSAINYKNLKPGKPITCPKGFIPLN